MCSLGFKSHYSPETSFQLSHFTNYDPSTYLSCIIRIEVFSEPLDLSLENFECSKFNARTEYSPLPIKQVVSKPTPTHKPEKKSKKNKLKGTADLYIINPEKILRNEDNRQFMMIKNIPNSFTQEKLLLILESYVKYEIEFFYLPLDKATGCNLGYGYVSLVDHHSVLKLYYAVGN